jgi:hypothetical protein
VSDRGCAERLDVRRLWSSDPTAPSRGLADDSATSRARRDPLPAIVKPTEPLPEAGLFQGCAGGTSIDAALTRALKIIETHPGALRKSDVVLVTNGGSGPTSARAPPGRRAPQRDPLGLGIGVSIDALTPWCSEVHTVEDLTSLDAPIATSLFAA